jgi:uncharacterized protein
MSIPLVVKWTLIGLVLAYSLLLVGMYMGQRRLLYFPDPARTAPAAVGLRGVVERVIETPDGQKIIAWYSAAKPGQPTLLFFHGNGGSLVGRSQLLAKYIARGRGVFIMSYRGFSGSTGSPTEASNVADAKLAFDTLVKDGVMPTDIILYGESLGTGVAIQVGLDKPAAGIILDSPYTAVVDRAAELYPWLPVYLLALDRYESRRHIATLRLPLLIVHGELDAVVPVAMGRKLYALAAAPKQLVTLPGAGHNNHDLFGSFQAIDTWINALRGAVAPR